MEGVEPERMNRRDAWFAILLTAILLLAYHPAWHGTPIFDDAMRIPKPADQSLRGLVRVWMQPSTQHQYHPLVDSVFWLETKMFKQRMTGYHVVNVLAHAAAALLLLKILRRLAVSGAWLAVALFALHPLQVESVAFLAEIKNTLSALFLFAAVLSYLAYTPEEDRKYLWLTWLFFIVGLFAKASTAYLPVIVLLIAWWQHGRIEWQRDVRPLFPFVVVGILAAIATSWFEWRPGTAAEAGIVLSPVDRILIAGRTFWFYLAKIFWPVNLRMFYPRWTINPAAWWQYLFPLGALIVVIIGWAFRRRFRGVWVGLMLFIFTLLPFVGFFNMRMFRFQFVAEHFAYLPIIGVVIPIASGLAVLLQRMRGWRRYLCGTAIGVVLIALTVLTWRHSAAFRNAEVCYRDSIDKCDENWIANVNLAVILIPQHKYTEAEGRLRKALLLNPPEVESISGIHLDLGQVLRQQHKPNEAAEEFERSIELRPNFRACDALASIQHEQGKTEDAIANYRKAMELEPNSPVAYANLSWILATASTASFRNGAQALQLASQANKLSGGSDPYSLRALAAAYAETGNYLKAIETGKLAWQRANENHVSELANRIQSDLALYQINLPARGLQW